jgi:hypothetical protein
MNLRKLFRSGLASKDQVFFVHFPSCAGSTFWAVLKAQYGVMRVLRIKNVGSWEDSLAQGFQSGKFQKLDAIGGHISFQLAKQHCPERQFITFLRHPVDRSQSLYRRKIRNGKWTRDENLGERDIVRFWQREVNEGKMRSYFAPAADVDPTVDQVFEVISNEMSAFGLMERFDHSLFLMAGALGWDEAPVYLPRNIGNSQRKTLSESVQAELAEILAFDIEVFDRLLVEFDRRWDMFAAAADPALLEDYRAKLARRRKTVTMLNFGRSPFTKKNKD